MNPRRVVVLGGSGTFGRLIAEKLAGQAHAPLIVAGRSAEKGQSAAKTLGAEFRQCDASDARSLQSAIDGAWLVVNASGPFRAGDYAIPQTCIEAGCHCIDLADGRQYVSEISQLDAAARAKNLFVCAGASTTPAITSAMVATLATKLGPIRSIRVALNAGNKNPAGVSTIATILNYVGSPIDVWQDGEWRKERGWSGGEFVEFPSPAGRRRVQLCDVPDLSLFPARFGAADVSFKAGVELTLLNYLIGGLAAMKRCLPAVDLPSLTKPLVAASKLLKGFGTYHGACAVWLRDREGQERSLALVAHENGPRIPGSPAILLARKLLVDQVDKRGAFPCMGFLEMSEFAEFLAPFRIFLVEGENGVWRGTGF